MRALSSVLAAAMALPAVSAVPVRPAGAAPPPAAALSRELGIPDRATAFDRLRVASVLLDHRSLGLAMEVAERTSWVAPPAAPPVVQPSASRALRAVPPPIRAAVATLLGAISEVPSGDSLQSSTVGSPSRLAGWLDGDKLRGTSIALPIPLRRPAPMPPVPVERVEAHALVIARAIDATLPILRRYAQTLPRRTSAAPTECDVADDPPQLCIGGTGSNTYTHDYELLIDLGGDDTYENSAGGADPQKNGLSVSVVIALGSTNRFVTETPTRTGARAAQGAGVEGGIGILVCGGGSDSFTITSTRPASQSDGAYGQGFGLRGVGILADLGGSHTFVIRRHAADVYTADDHKGAYPGSSNALHTPALGEGYGENGIGVVMDVQTTPGSAAVIDDPVGTVDRAGLWRGGVAAAAGFGVGAGTNPALGAAQGAVEAPGVGVYAAVGSASVEVDAVTDAQAPGDLRPAAESDAYALGFGVGVGGTGLVASSGGRSWTVSASNPVSDDQSADGTAAFGLGMGELGFGGLYSAGGNDQYVAEAINHPVRRHVTTDACRCHDETVTTAAGNVETFAEGASLLGVGVLWDVQGNDLYLARADAIADAESSNLRTQRVDAAPGAITQQNSDWTFAVIAQGIGLVGAGYVEDDQGDDTFQLEGWKVSRSMIRAAHPDLPAFIGGATQNTRVVGQAAALAGGYGELRHLQGTATYNATALSELIETTPRGTSVTGGGGRGFAWAQPGLLPGDLNVPPPIPVPLPGAIPWPAVAHLVDSGGATFTTYPSEPVCSGMRGSGVWEACGIGLGVGVEV